MTRQEAMKRLKEEYAEALAQTKQLFWEQAQEQYETFAQTLKQLFHSLREEMEKTEKDKLMHLYFSLLRIDLQNRKYRVMVQAMDASWYLDEHPIYLTFSVDDLFQVLHPIWDQMLEGSKKYMGKVNAYDISNMMQELAMECNGLLAHQLRFMLRDIEENKDFANIPKEETWYIRWGEYRDKSEIVAHVDRIPKDQKQWDRSVRKAEQKEDELIAGYWYQTDIANTNCQGKLMYFINFEDCTIKNICFDRVNLTGARFRNCRLIGCSFKEGILRQTEFTDCTWDDNVFTGADLTNAVFMEQEIPYIHLEADQLQTILVDRRQERA